MAIRSIWTQHAPQAAVPFLTLLLTGCTALSVQAQYYFQPSSDYYRDDQAEGTVVGGALGAITGALIGGSGKRGEGALIGAGVGALTGNVLGRNKDHADERRAATGAAVVAQANQQAAARAITNYDLIRMTQAGVSDDLIISTIRARGARLDLSPAALISLKESGVSDRVMIAAQGMTRGQVVASAPASTTVVTDPLRPNVIVSPVPRRVYHHYYVPRPYHRRMHIHYGVGF